MPFADGARTVALSFAFEALMQMAHAAFANTGAGAGPPAPSTLSMQSLGRAEAASSGVPPFGVFYCGAVYSRTWPCWNDPPNELYWQEQSREQITAAAAGASSAHQENVLQYLRPRGHVRALCRKRGERRETPSPSIPAARGKRCRKPHRTFGRTGAGVSRATRARQRSIRAGRSNRCLRSADGAKAVRT